MSATRRARAALFARALMASSVLAAVFALAAGAVLAAVFALPAEAATASTRGATARVLVTRLEGPVTPMMAEALTSVLRRAERGGFDAVVLEIDTPGGLESSMRDMVKDLFASSVPVIAWVTPSGGRAASAGVFVTLACDVAAMAPGTNIGAATPISMQGPMDSTLARKATNDAAAFARTIAIQRGRNADWAELAVRQAVAVDEREAVRLGVVDFTASTLTELLALSDGRTWRRGSGSHRLRVGGAAVERIEPGFRQRLLSRIADPNLAYLLLMLGFYGILFELQNPGSVLPGIVGGISLVLAFLALSMLPVNTAGVALIALAVVFFVAEIKVASHGLLAVGGVISMLLGSIILFHGDSVRLSWGIVAGGTLATSLFFLVIVGAGLRAQRLRVTTGSEGLCGARGNAIERLAPSGRVRVRGELWNAVSETEVEAGSEVEVTGSERLTLRVRPASREDPSCRS